MTTAAPRFGALSAGRYQRSAPATPTVKGGRGGRAFCPRRQHHTARTVPLAPRLKRQQQRLAAQRRQLAGSGIGSTGSG